MAFLKLNDDFLMLGDERLALHGALSARLSESGGGTGRARLPRPSSTIQGSASSGKVTTETASGKVRR